MLDWLPEQNRGLESQQASITPSTGRGVERWRSALEIATIVAVGTTTFALALGIPVTVEGVLGRGLSFQDIWLQPMPDVTSYIHGPLKVSYGFFYEMSAIAGMALGLGLVPVTATLLKRFS